MYWLSRVILMFFHFLSQNLKWTKKLSGSSIQSCTIKRTCVILSNLSPDGSISSHTRQIAIVRTRRTTHFSDTTTILSQTNQSGMPSQSRVTFMNPWTWVAWPNMYVIWTLSWKVVSSHLKPWYITRTPTTKRDTTMQHCLSELMR